MTRNFLYNLPLLLLLTPCLALGGPASSGPAAPAGACNTDRSGRTVTLSGTVHDQTGGVVISAHIVARCGDIDHETDSHEDGSWTLRVPAATYSVEVSRPGFESQSRDVRADAATAPLDFSLALAHAVANVSVNASEGYIAESSSSATKSDALILDTPQSISVITNDQLQERGVQTLNESLRYTPGVAVESYGVDPRYDSFLIRGFGDSTNGFFIDGLRFPGYLGQTDPYMAEDVTVLKGPSSVLYGQSAPGGLVNITSKRPPTSSVHEIGVDFGSYDRKQVSGDFGGLFDSDGHWRYRLTALYRDSGTQVNYSPDDRWFVMPALTWAPTEKTSITFLSYYQRDHTGWAQFLPAEGTLYANPYGQIPVDFFTGVPGFDGVHRQQWSLGYILDHRVNHTWTFHQAFRTYNVVYDGATAYGVGLANDLQTLNRDAYTFRDTDTLYQVDNQAQASLRTGFLQHSILAGYDFSRTGDYPTGAYAGIAGINVFHPDYATAVPALTSYLNERQWQLQSGVYVQDQLRFAEHWTMLLSGREDIVNADTHNLIGGSATPSSDNHFSGRAGVSYSAPFGFAPYVSYSSSFLPLVGVNYYGQPYVPTTGRQFETGLKFQPAGWNSFLTASFYNIDENHIQTADPDNPLNTIQVGQARSRGAEVEAVTTLRQGLALHFGYSFDNAKVTETTDPDQLGMYLLSVPRQTASSFLDYAFPKGPLLGLGAGFGVRYVGVSAGSPDNSILVPGYTLFDGSVHYDWKMARFSVNATNIGNKEYVGVCNSISYCNYGFARRIIGSIVFRW